MTTSINDGGPAFPLQIQYRTTPPDTFPGMTLRVYLAAKALPVIVSTLAREDLDFLSSEAVRQECALQAFAMADTMIEQMNKT